MYQNLKDSYSYVYTIKNELEITCFRNYQNRIIPSQQRETHQTLYMKDRKVRKTKVVDPFWLPMICSYILLSLSLWEAPQKHRLPCLMMPLFYHWISLYMIYHTIRPMPLNYSGIGMFITATSSKGDYDDDDNDSVTDSIDFYI